MGQSPRYLIGPRSSGVRRKCLERPRSRRRAISIVRWRWYRVDAIFCSGAPRLGMSRAAVVPATSDFCSSIRKRSSKVAQESFRRPAWPWRTRSAQPTSQVPPPGSPVPAPGALVGHPSLAGLPTRGRCAGARSRATRRGLPGWKCRSAPRSHRAPDVEHGGEVAGPASLKREGLDHRRFSLPLRPPTALPLAAGDFSPRDQLGPRHAASASEFHSAHLGP